MNYLQLCQAVARESGTVSGVLPVSVANVTGRLAKIVAWTAEAWQHIQNLEEAWLWMDAEFTGNLAAGAQRYTAASFNLTRFAAWGNEQAGLSAYLASAGRAEEYMLRRMEWRDFKRLHDFGAIQQSRPVHYAVSPANELCFGPVPDAPYVVRGEYRKGNQTLAANEDVPEMPERFHMLIVWYALVLLAEHDEAPTHIATSNRRYRDLLTDLRRDQLPEVRITSRPLA